MTTELLARALAAEVPADSDHILDAALAIAAASGLRHLTMDDVARRAGVGRMTVYRRFGTREALLDALTAREARRCLAEMDAVSPADAPIEDQVVAGFVTGLRITREHPLLSRLARIEPDTVLQALTADSSALFSLLTRFVTGRLQVSQRAGVLSPNVVAAEAAELLVRVTLSFVMLPDSALPLDDPELARRLLAPILQTRSP